MLPLHKSENHPTLFPHLAAATITLIPPCRNHPLLQPPLYTSIHHPYPLPHHHIILTPFLNQNHIQKSL
ncbi:hypothetical protein C1H46_043840 [Malus baccata]|uniref:Uncharacterized protein n=1 Tax=Malus baccata TaxID=106549 RepID=A0A540K8S8_MALBA|nr:hypothetical protein C1H46_043840 [Malus baccata]